MLRDSVMKIHSYCNFGYYHAVVLISDCIYRPHSKRASWKYRTPPPPPRNLSLWSQNVTKGCPEQNLNGQPFGCTQVIDLCVRVSPGIRPVADWAQHTNSLFRSHVLYGFVKQWPKCSLKYLCRFLPHCLEQTPNSTILWPSVTIFVQILNAECQKGHITVCPVFLIWHISVAHFGISLLRIIAYVASLLMWLQVWNT